MDRLRVAVLGSGNIGADLLMKIRRSEFLECAVFIGRHMSSPGLARAHALGVPISADGIERVVARPDDCDLVFDATSAAAHMVHAPILAALGKRVIDLTPAKAGVFCVPAVNADACLSETNLNMVTCGGQASVPIAHALGRVHADIEYIEIVSSIASRSAGPATRRNIDEYIRTTEEAVREFSGCRRVKAILNLNPAVPCVDMRTTVFAKIADPDLDACAAAIAEATARVRAYVPGYEPLVAPRLDAGRVTTMVRVRGRGDFLPPYAGNLDIINCAAVAMAERCAGRVEGA